MLHFINLLRLRNSEFIQFFTDLITILIKYKPKELGIKEQMDPIIEDLDKIKSIQGTSRGSDISKELDDIDDRRDDCINGILGVLEAYTYHYNPELKEAAELLIKKINTYGTGIARQNYPTETASLNGISEAFSSEPVLKKALANLNLTEWAGKMKEENDYFNMRYLDRVDEISKITDDKIKELRKTTTEGYYTLRNHLNAYATLKQASFKSLMGEVNELIEKYNKLIKRRSGGKSKSEE